MNAKLIFECRGVQKVGDRYMNCFEWGALWLDHPLTIGKQYEIEVREVPDGIR